MARQTRRNFLKTSAVFSASFVIAGTKASGKVIGANDTIRIGVAGLNGRGSSHVGEWSGMKNVAITYLIDPDTMQASDLIHSPNFTQAHDTTMFPDCPGPLNLESFSVHGLSIHETSPGIFDVMAVLEKAATLRRIGKAAGSP